MSEREAFLEVVITSLCLVCVSLVIGAYGLGRQDGRLAQANEQGTSAYDVHESCLAILDQAERTSWLTRGSQETMAQLLGWRPNPPQRAPLFMAEAK